LPSLSGEFGKNKWHGNQGIREKKKSEPGGSTVSAARISTNDLMATKNERQWKNTQQKCSKIQKGDFTTDGRNHSTTSQAK
jgi:hypothetical protein